MFSAPAGAQQLLDHFMCYSVSGKVVNAADVVLEDQFDQMMGIVEIVTVNRPTYFCNPVRKTRPGEVTDILDINAHLKWYSITTTPVPNRTVMVANQFGPLQKLSVKQPKWLAVPTRKDTQPAPQSLDHFKCYLASGPSVGATVTLEDQFELDRNFVVLKPQRFCNPVKKVHLNETTPVLHPEAHLVCYDVARPFLTANQFGEESMYVRKMSLCVPSRKLSVN